MRIAVFIVLTCVGLPVLAQSSRPGDENRPAAMLQRLEQSIQKLDLSADQRTQVRTIVSDARSKFGNLREKAGDDMMQTRDGARRILTDAREELLNVLTPRQQEKLRDLMQGNDRRPNEMERPRRNRDQPPPMEPEMRSEKPAEQEQPKPDAAKSEPAPVGPAVGEPAPDFNLQKLDGRAVSLSSFKGKPLVLIFGSYSSPSFRQRAPAIQELSTAIGSRAGVLIIYTKEAHPKDGWQVERNRDENVIVPAHTDAQSRAAQAKQARESLKLTVAIAADGMDDAVAKAYGAGENTAFVIGRDGKVIARQNWLDAFNVRRLIDESASAIPAD